MCVRRQPLVIVSSKFNNTLATTVHAANSNIDIRRHRSASIEAIFFAAGRLLRYFSKDSHKVASVTSLRNRGSALGYAQPKSISRPLFGIEFQRRCHSTRQPIGTLDECFIVQSGQGLKGSVVRGGESQLISRLGASKAMNAA